MTSEAPLQKRADIDITPVSQTSREVVNSNPASTPIYPKFGVGFERSQKRSRFGLRAVVFVVVVVIPTALAAIYYGNIASSQYVTDIQLGVRPSESTSDESTSFFQGGASASQIALQSNVIVQYIKSRAIVNAINGRFDLRAAFARPSIDTLSRLDPNASIEGLVEYWRDHVEPFFDLTTGIITVRIKAFTPQDAQTIGNLVLSLSSELADDLSLRARLDYVKLAQEQVDRAAKQLSQARAAILDFRNMDQTLDPTKEADVARQGIAKLRDELARVQTDISTGKARMNARSPTILGLLDRQAALELQIKDSEAKLTGTQKQNGKPLSQNMQSYDALETERILTEKAYDTSLQGLQRAQFEAAKHTIYLEVFERPSLAEEAAYPRRVVSVLVVGLSALGIWIFLLMAYYSIRDHI